jgi:hypothetical protein
LAIFLHQEGFCSIQRVGVFNLLNDTSAALYLDHFISLNIIATKCFNASSDGIPPIGSVERSAQINEHLLDDSVVSDMGLSEAEVDTFRRHHVVSVKIPPLRELHVPFSPYQIKPGRLDEGHR